MKKLISACLAGLLIIGVIAGTLYYFENYDKIYYTKIDNKQMEIIPASDDMKYQYTLKSYDENGHARNFKFKASKELREDAYLQLEVRITGVYKWKEVQPNEMPEKALEKLK